MVRRSGSIKLSREENEIRGNRLWQLRNVISETRIGKHDVYWGTHACSLESDHWKDECICTCGASPNKNSICWGDDAKQLSEIQIKRRLYRQRKEETSEMTIVVGDIKDTIVNGRYRQSMKLEIRRVKRSVKRVT